MVHNQEGLPSTPRSTPDTKESLNELADPRMEIEKGRLETAKLMAETLYHPRYWYCFKLVGTYLESVKMNLDPKTASVESAKALALAKRFSDSVKKIQGHKGPLPAALFENMLMEGNPARFQTMQPDAVLTELMYAGIDPEQIGPVALYLLIAESKSKPEASISGATTPTERSASRYLLIMDLPTLVPMLESILKTV